MKLNPVEFTWTGSNEREDNTAYPDAERRGYNVYVYPVGNPVPTTPTFVAIATADNYGIPISDLAIGDGTYEMVVTDTDIFDQESDPSEAVQFRIGTVAPPKPPAGLAAL